MVSGKHKLKKLSNPLRPVAQQYVNDLTWNLPLVQRQAFRLYLQLYLDKIPFYLKNTANNDKSTATDDTQQTTAKNKKVKGRKRRLSASKELIKLLSSKKTHSKKQRVLLPVKQTQFTKQGIIQQSKKVVEKKECKKDDEPPIKLIKK